ncbi:MAG: hypothetical protein EB120_07810, partial [Proteobacteria bacterium]|nr:hypothetical protein [Pseudomonadota bacterium]
NLILLDEPTNHLDVETKDLLKQSIRDFEGTTILVSHDREFVEDIAERILYLSHDHQLTDHLGDLESFFEKYPQFVRHLEGRGKPSQAPVAVSAPTSETQRPQLSYEERKKVKNQVKSLEKKITLVEGEIDTLGQEKERLQEKMNSQNFSSSPSDEKNQLYERLGHVESLLRNAMVDWEKWSSELETLKPLLGNS